MNIQSAKKELRGRISAQIDALPDDYITGSDKGIYRNVISMKEFTGARNIFMYHSVGKEPGTLQIAQTAFEMGKTVAFPYCFRGGVMQARVVTSLHELIPAVLGIPAPPVSAPVIAPEDLDLIFVPALAFDKEGYRLGYGGGYYDRYLSGLNAFTVGLTRQRLTVDELPAESHDVAVFCVITETEVIRLCTKACK